VGPGVAGGSGGRRGLGVGADGPVDPDWWHRCANSSDIVLSEIVNSESVPPVRSALLALQRATHATLHLIATELVDLDLTASELNALANLSDGRGRTVSQLGAAVGARPTTLTSVLDRLERRGHVTRGVRAGDRRSVLVELTDSGRAAADLIRRTLADLENRALDGLPGDAIAGFHAVLAALTEERP
jgi:MarR family transcriptional regulator, organic hydroperoxide resistance regulator